MRRRCGGTQKFQRAAKLFLQLQARIAVVKFVNLNSREGAGPVILQLLRTPDGVKAVFDDGLDAPNLDLFSSDRSLPESVVAESPDEAPAANDQFLTLRKLAGDLYQVIELEGARLGWTASQIRAFQAPVERIRDAAQAILDRKPI